jgi:undecaprenyl-diphosphatase
VKGKVMNIPFIIQSFDNSILLFIKNNLHFPVLDKLMIFITDLGNGGFIWVIISLLLISNKKYRHIGILTLSSLLVTTSAGDEVLKNIVHRIRPSANIPVASLLIKKPISYSFPSGHAASSFAAATILSKYFKYIFIIKKSWNGKCQLFFKI